MKEITLGEVIPRASEFTLRQTGKTYRLRPVTLDDEIWIERTYQDKGGLSQVLATMNIPEICRAVFHQLVPEDQAEFAQRDVTFIDEDTGCSETKKVGGFRLLFALVSGNAEKIALYSALMDTIGVSRPIIEAAEDAILKKKVGLTALAELAEPTGAGSSTSFLPSTGGPLSTSEAAQPGRSNGASRESSPEGTTPRGSRQKSTDSKSRRKKKAP